MNAIDERGKVSPERTGGLHSLSLFGSPAQSQGGLLDTCQSGWGGKQSGRGYCGWAVRRAQDVLTETPVTR